MHTYICTHVCMYIYTYYIYTCTYACMNVALQRKAVSELDGIHLIERITKEKGIVKMSVKIYDRTKSIRMRAPLKKYFQRTCSDWTSDKQEYYTHNNDQMNSKYSETWHIRKSELNFNFRTPARDLTYTYVRYVNIFTSSMCIRTYITKIRTICALEC